MLELSATVWSLPSLLLSRHRHRCHFCCFYCFVVVLVVVVLAVSPLNGWLLFLVSQLLGLLGYVLVNVLIVELPPLATILCKKQTMALLFLLRSLLSRSLKGRLSMLLFANPFRIQRSIYCAAFQGQ